MKILIVENEIYLAGSVASKLSSLGHECEIAKSAKEAMRDENFDVVLLSTTLPGQDFYPVIERYGLKTHRRGCRRLRTKAVYV